jgi:hypothetical protein
VASCWHSRPNPPKWRHVSNRESLRPGDGRTAL